MEKGYPNNSVYWVIVAMCIMFNSSYALSTCIDVLPIASLAAIFVLLSVPFFLKEYMWKVDLYGASILFFILGIFATMVVNEDINAWGSYLRIIVLIYTSYIFVKVVKIERFKKYFFSFLDISCIVSFVMYVLVNILNLGNIFPSYINSNGVSYFSAYLSFILEHSPLRIMGPFWEPGIFSTFLVLGVLFELFKISRRIYWYRVLLYSVAILFTMSTAGYIILFIAFLLKFKESQYINSYYLKSIFVYFLIAIILLSSDVLISFLSQVLPDVFGKLTLQESVRMTRIVVPEIDLSIWMTSLISGIGLGDYSLMWYNGNFIDIADSRTSTVTFYFAVFGITGFIYVFLLGRGCLRQDTLRFDNRIILFLIFNMILLKEPHNFNLLTYILLGYLNKSGENYFE